MALGRIPSKFVVKSKCNRGDDDCCVAERQSYVCEKVRLLKFEGGKVVGQGIIGGILKIWGRVSAGKPVERNQALVYPAESTQQSLAPPCFQLMGNGARRGSRLCGRNCVDVSPGFIGAETEASVRREAGEAGSNAGASTGLDNDFSIVIFKTLQVLHQHHG